jgi:hypothetical protein
MNTKKRTYVKRKPAVTKRDDYKTETAVSLDAADIYGTDAPFNWKKPEDSNGALLEHVEETLPGSWMKPEVKKYLSYVTVEYDENTPDAEIVESLREAGAVWPNEDERELRSRISYVMEGLEAQERSFNRFADRQVSYDRFIYLAVAAVLIVSVAALGFALAAWL